MNFVASVKAAGHFVVGADTNTVHLLWSVADVKIKSPPQNDSSFRAWLDAVCGTYEIDVIHSQPEQGVLWLAQQHHSPVYKLPAATFLPDSRVILNCQDKFETSWRWAKAELRPSPVVRIEAEDQLVEAVNQFGLPFWLRATRGAGARGATPCDSIDVAVNWMRYWEARGVDWEWIAEEYLPGRDYAWTSIWYEGALLVSQGRERIEYIYPHLAPSGRTGTPTVAVTVHDDRVNDVASEAVLAIDEKPHGVYCVDLREDADNSVVPTEINAGRFFTTSHFYTEAGCNFADITIQCALGEPDWKLPSINALPEGLWWVRHIDCPAVLVTNQEMAEIAEQATLKGSVLG